MSLLPTSRTVVNPASSTFRAWTVDSIAFSATSRRKPSTNSCFQSSVDSPVRWVCASMKPGESVASPRSMTSAPAGMARSVPTARIFGPWTRTTAVGLERVGLAVEQPRGLDGDDRRRLGLLGRGRVGDDQEGGHHGRGERRL